MLGKTISLPTTHFPEFVLATFLVDWSTLVLDLVAYLYFEDTVLPNPSILRVRMTTTAKPTTSASATVNSWHNTRIQLLLVGRQLQDRNNSTISRIKGSFY